jgi:two-component system phosphate regulon sensor histidine kinase PhoR
MANENILLFLSDPNISTMLERGALRPAGYEVTVVLESEMAETLVKSTPPDLIILGEKLPDGDGYTLGMKLLERFPALPIILLLDQASDKALLRAIRVGFAECLLPPLRTGDVIRAVQGGLEKRRRFVEWSSQEVRRSSKALQKRLTSLETLQRVGRSVTSQLDLNGILTTVVDSAVELTGAEEGSLLLLDETSGELYMRAARNFQEDFVRKFRLPIRDTLPGQVMRTGKPIAINETTPQKIKTSYLVHTLIYFPLQVHSRVIGVLGVDNRQSGHPFLQEHMDVLAALSDYAAIAIENARAYERSDLERSKLETILTRVEDGVIAVDAEGRLLIVNQTIRSAFHLDSGNLVGKPVRDIFQHPDLLEVFETKHAQPTRGEISLEDGRIFNAQVTPIPEVGLVVTMQDITHLKELDRIKSDFVSTVSHDLRSPLTAILGYVELLDRAGPLSDQQREFIRRVQFSVNNITSLINDLLDLGRIEAGFDTRKEIVYLSAIIQYSVEGQHSRVVEKEQEMVMNVPDKLPPILGNPVRLRQMAANLIGNAVKYTPVKGKITVQLSAEGDQLLFQVIDNGPGIPVADQPYIFDKFYRAGNVPMDTPGTGLGLAIVKSIVENHQGRIWVESSPGIGTTFTVVLPVADQNF